MNWNRDKIEIEFSCEYTHEKNILTQHVNVYIL